MSIPKYPEVPDLTEEQIQALTNIIFLEEALFQYQQKYDLIFVFGGSHPGNWQTAFHAYRDRLADKILLTGGIKPNVIRHKEWKGGDTAESHVMRKQLLKLGVPEKALIIEDRSTNSLENILFAQELFDFKSVRNVLFICKSFAAGRQYRTLKKHLPKQIHIAPYPFDSSLINDQIVTRDNWMNDSNSRSFVYGEYLRILAYGTKGDIEPLEKAIPELATL